MSFYLEESSGEIAFISNNYLKKKLIDSSSLSVVKPVTVNIDEESKNIEKNFLNRIGITIPTLSSEKCANIILDRIDYDNLEDLSAVAALDRVHILTIGYLLYSGAMSTADLKTFLHADSVYTRNSLLLQYLAADDREINIFDGLYDSIFRYSQKEMPTEDSIEKQFQRLEGISCPFEKTGYISLRLLQDYSGDTLGKELDSYNMRNIFSQIDVVVDELESITKKSFKWLRILGYSAAGIGVATLNVGVVLQLLLSATGLAKLEGNMLRVDVAKVLNEFIKNISIGLALEDFNKRMGETSQNHDDYITQIFAESFANGVNAAIKDQLQSIYWVLYDIADKYTPENAYLYKSLLKANVLQWQNELGMNIDEELVDPAEKEKESRKKYLSTGSFYPFKFFKQYDIENVKTTVSATRYTVDYTKGLNRLKFDTSRSLENTIWKGFAEGTARFSYSTGLLNVTADVLSDSFLNGNFISFVKDGNGLKIGDLSASTKNKLLNIAAPNYLISTERLGVNKEFYKVFTFGSGDLSGVIRDIINSSMTESLKSKTTKDLQTVQSIVNYIKEIKESISTNGFGVRSGRKDPLIPIAYDIIMNYLDFLAFGNTIYDYPANSENLFNYINTDNGEVTPPSKTENWDTLFNSKSFMPAISKYTYAYYKLLYVIKHLPAEAVDGYFSLNRLPIWDKFINICTSSDSGIPKSDNRLTVIL